MDGFGADKFKSGDALMSSIKKRLLKTIGVAADE